jgi:hypothetical protein
MCFYTEGMRRLPAALAILSGVVALLLVPGVSAAPTGALQACATPVFQNGLDLVFGRARTQAGADRITQRALRVGFKGVQTVQASCSQWASVLRGLNSFDTAVSVQSEARRVKLFPTIECVKAEEIGQFQAIFGTRRTLQDLDAVIDRAKSFGYIGLKTKTAPCGGYQAYVAGFSSEAQARGFAATASDRTGLHVVVIKA